MWWAKWICARMGFGHTLVWRQYTFLFSIVWCVMCCTFFSLRCIHSLWILDGCGCERRCERLSMLFIIWEKHHFLLYSELLFIIIFVYLFHGVWRWILLCTEYGILNTVCNILMRPHAMPSVCTIYVRRTSIVCMCPTVYFNALNIRFDFLLESFFI